MEALWPVLKEDAFRSSRDYHVVLAPMVRAGSLALRSLSLDYGASLVWSEEIIDQKLSRSERIVNSTLNTIDYIVDNRTILFRTHECEKGRIILQLGTNSAATALKAAQLVQDDVAGIDINMGCPKTFSIQANMGAALLKESRHEVACDIISTLKKNLRSGLPVTAKIRLLDAVEQAEEEKERDDEGDKKGKKKSRRNKKKKANKEHRTGHDGNGEVSDQVKEDGSIAMDDATSLSLSIARTIDFLRELQSAGVDAVSIHLRLRGDAQTEPARTWETMKMLVEGVPDLPLLCNGDMYSLSIAQEMCARSGCKGVMIGRPLLLNTSLIRPEGVLALQEVKKAFIRKCIQYDVVYQVVKYTLMEMMVLRRHPPAVLDALIVQDPSFWADKVTKGPMTMSPYWELVTRSKSLGHVCEAYGMLDEYNATYVSSEILTGNKKANKGISNEEKKRKLEDTMDHPAHFDDAYFAQDLKEGATNDGVSVKVANGKVELIHPDIATFTFPTTSAVIRLASSEDIDDIVRITNDAYVADEFFKKPEYYQRFTREDVEEMIAAPQSFFLLASVDGENCHGSLYLSFTIVHESSSQQPLIQIQGNFGAVAVMTDMSRRGIGKSLIRGAEAFVLHLQNLLSTFSLPEKAALGGSAVHSTLEMGVINLREDLFRWYDKLGYRKLQPMPQNEELQRICLPELNVCCILMRKELKIYEERNRKVL